jgi:hypothetical protein
MVGAMSIATDGEIANGNFAIEDLSTGLRASGFGQVGDGRSFSFRLDDKRTLIVEIYRPRFSGPVPQEEDIVAVSSRSLVHVDVHDERSLAVAVRDAVADAQPVQRNH